MPLDTDLDVVDERVQAVLSSMVSEENSRFKKRSFTVFAPTNRYALGMAFLPFELAAELWALHSAARFDRLGPT